MPLLDHFHPPLAGRRHWEAFHAHWATFIASSLNSDLPSDYFAEAQVHASPRIEVDVGTWRDRGTDDGGVATLTRTQPKIISADLTLPTVFPPEYSINVYNTSGGPTLVAAIELVSPGNKDRDDVRRAFSAKCAAMISRAIGLIIVDIVTSRHSEPFRDLMTMMFPQQPLPELAPLTAASFRPTRVDEADTLEVRHRPLGVGQPLPTLPLALGGLGWINVDFEAAYEEAREHSRL